MPTITQKPPNPNSSTVATFKYTDSEGGVSFYEFALFFRDRLGCRSALFLVVRQSHADATIAALRPFSGDVIQTTLDSEAEEALRSALV